MKYVAYNLAALLGMLGLLFIAAAGQGNAVLRIIIGGRVEPCADHARQSPGRSSRPDDERHVVSNGMIYSGGGFDTGQAIPEQEMAPLLVRIRDTARELGMKFLWYTPTQYCRLSPIELEIGAKRCNAGEYSLCVEPNADVLPCQSYYTAAGNLLRDPWEKIWNGELFRSFRDREDDPRRHGLPEMCWECPDLPLCGGGCRIEREAREGLRTGDGGCAGGCCGSGGCGTGGQTSSAGFVTVESLLGAGKLRGSGVFSEA
ncbi:MAG: SPASM domain-containing protein [Planctomycetia bacterium]|nr:SPASM domain-containing protein [Planctomycetia bacterium]